MMNAWRGFWRMDPSSRRVALEGCAALAATWGGLRMFGFRRWKAALVALTPRPTAAAAGVPAEPARMATAQDVARILVATSRHLTFHTSCLEQSLVLWWLLGRRGIPADLRIGARKEAGRFEAHAWVESGIVVLNNSSEGHAHFSPFDGPIASMETQPH
jgi:hypothetical protein